MRRHASWKMRMIDPDHIEVYDHWAGRAVYLLAAATVVFWAVTYGMWVAISCLWQWWR